MNISFDELIQYTDWQRARWRERLAKEGDAILAMSAGPHGDGRINTIGELIRHIFSAELRYCQRLSGEALTDPAKIPDDRLDALFTFGERTRARLRAFIASWPESEWDSPREMKVLHFHVAATPRKIVAHALLHEVRHWAQLANMLRLKGKPGEFEDFLMSPVLGGEFRAAG